MPNLRTPEEVMAFIKNHCFANRYHFQATRALILWKYGRIKELKELNYKYPFNSGISMDLPIITANDAIKFLTEK
jgi:hypothetical protein